MGHIALQYESQHAIQYRFRTLLESDKNPDKTMNTFIFSVNSRIVYCDFDRWTFRANVSTNELSSSDQKCDVAINNCIRRDDRSSELPHRDQEYIILIQDTY